MLVAFKEEQKCVWITVRGDKSDSRSENSAMQYHSGLYQPW